MATIYVQTPGYENAMNFSAKRLEGSAVRAIKEKYPEGLSTNPEALETALKVGDYVSVLKPLWGERDKQKRLEWLRDERLKFHPVLPYERALAELSLNPTVETTVKVTSPLLVMGGLRSRMDARCSKDPSIRGCCDMMDGNYGTALKNLLAKKIPGFTELSKEQQKEMIKVVVSHLKELEEELSKKESTVPSPAWLEHYGLGGFAAAFGDDPVGMRSKEEWNSIRLQFVREQIQEAEKKLEELA